QSHVLPVVCFFFFSSRRRHTRSKRDWSSDVCSSDLSRPSERTMDCLTAVCEDTAPLFYDPLLIRSYEATPSVSGKAASCVHCVRSEERRVGKACRARGVMDS